MVSALDSRAARLRVLAGAIVLCSWGRHLTLAMPLSTRVWEWEPVNLMMTSMPSRGCRKILSRFIIQKPDITELRLYGTLTQTHYFTRNLLSRNIDDAKVVFEFCYILICSYWFFVWGGGGPGNVLL